MKASPAALQEVFPLLEIPEIPPRGNICPTQTVAAVRDDSAGKPHFVNLRWGLIPFWADDMKIGARLINARGETVAEKPAFRTAFRKRRCLIVADGFYEWQTINRKKQPYHFARRDGKPFAFAGLWERWDKGESPIESCTIITTDANELVRPLHDRMPVILQPEDFERWLDPKEDSGMLQALLQPLPPQLMVSQVVAKVEGA